MHIVTSCVHDLEFFCNNVHVRQTLNFCIRVFLGVAIINSSTLSLRIILHSVSRALKDAAVSVVQGLVPRKDGNALSFEVFNRFDECISCKLCILIAVMTRVLTLCQFSSTACSQSVDAGYAFPCNLPRDPFRISRRRCFSCSCCPH